MTVAADKITCSAHLQYFASLEVRVCVLELAIREAPHHRVASLYDLVSHLAECHIPVDNGCASALRLDHLAQGNHQVESNGDVEVLSLVGRHVGFGKSVIASS